MELLLQVVIPLCLASLGTCMQLPTALGIQNPFDFDFQVDSINKNLNDNIKNIEAVIPGNSSFTKCFCLPNTSNSQLVTNQPGLKGPELERLVVYLYKNNGLLKAFVPNKQKQVMIPDLAFDDNSGDVLEPVFLEPIGEFYDSSSNAVKQSNPLTSMDENDTEIIGISELHSTTEASKGVYYDITEPADDNEIFFEDVNDLYPNPFEDNSVSDKFKSFDKPNELTDDVPDPVGQDELVNNSKVENIVNSYDPHQLSQILSLLPPDARLYLKSILPQLQGSRPENMNVNYITFDDWFKDQLMNFMLQNLRSPSKVKALRQRIKEVLESNDLYLSKNGLLLDSNGNIFNMDNVKLRPILIGDIVEYQKLLNQQQNNFMRTPDIPYRQMILITLVNPPEVLGIVPVGKVYLPRNINSNPNMLLIDEIDDVELRSGNELPNVGCKSCKLHTPQNALKQISGRYGIPYYSLPISSNSKNKEGQIMMQTLSNKPEVKSDVPQKKLNVDVKNGVDSLLQNVLGIFGTKNSAAPNRRLLGGLIRHTPKLIPKPLPKDNSPDIRIVGGQPATSSGTPVVSKGRSGFINNEI